MKNDDGGSPIEKTLGNTGHNALYVFLGGNNGFPHHR